MYWMLRSPQLVSSCVLLLSAPSCLTFGYQELTEAGVKLYEYTPGFMHAKVWVSDHTHAVVGTINLDYRSLYLHFECAAYLYRVPAIQDILDDFEDTFTKSQPVTAESIQNEKFTTKLAGRLLKVAAPLM